MDHLDQLLQSLGKTRPGPGDEVVVDHVHVPVLDRRQIGEPGTLGDVSRLAHGPGVGDVDGRVHEQAGRHHQAFRVRRSDGGQGRARVRDRRQPHRPARAASCPGTAGAGQDDPSRGFKRAVTRLVRTSVWPGIALAGGVFVACLLVSLAFGPASLSLGEVWHFVTTGPVHGDLPNAIFWQIRLPRVLVACLVGAELAVAGVILQDLFLNPLTDPYVTGVSSGAALGATIGIVLHLSNLPWMTVLALIGGFLTLGVVWMAARRC